VENRNNDIKHKIRARHSNGAIYQIHSCTFIRISNKIGGGVTSRIRTQIMDKVLGQIYDELDDHE